MTNPTVYTGYDTWKGWGEDQFMGLTPGADLYFDRDLRGVPVAGERVLEIGFGNGEFLAWCKARGAHLYGTELSERGQRLAAARDVIVLPSDLAVSLDAYRSGFGVIAAFDVLEHLSFDAIRTLLDQIALLLRPGGYCVARFPNGQSPFVGLHQAGDYTHISTLSASIMTQFTQGTALEIVRADSSAVPSPGVLRKLRGVARNGFEATLRGLYGIRTPLGPNLTVVLRKKEGAE